MYTCIQMKLTFNNTSFNRIRNLLTHLSKVYYTEVLTDRAPTKQCTLKEIAGCFIPAHVLVY